MKTTLTTLLLLCLTATIAQKTISSKDLEQKSFQELYNIYYANLSGKANDSLIATVYLQKAKKTNDTAHIAFGYLLFAKNNFGKPKYSIYLDSINPMIKHIKKDTILAKFYIYKGSYYFNNDRKFIKAIDYFTLGYKHAKKAKNNYLLHYASNNIGVLKIRLGEYQESIDILKNQAPYFLQQKDTMAYLFNLNGLSEAYKGLKKYKDASVINQKSHDFALQNNIKNYIPVAICQEGMLQYYQKNYIASIDSIQKALPFYINTNNFSNVAVYNYYLGMNHIALGNKTKAISYFQKVDSVFAKHQDLYPETRQSYEYLIDYYKTKGDTQKQLYYIEQLLALDQVLERNYKYLTKKITREYDTPALLQEKESLIAALNSKGQAATIKIVVLMVVLLLALLLLGYYYRQQRRYKRNFEKLLQDKTTTSPIVTPAAKRELAAVPEALEKEILEKLEAFENNCGFLDNDCNLIKVAKNMQTNAKYLSQTINTKKGLSFTNYINNLRVDYAVEKIKTDKSFRLYSIQGMAESVGFNSQDVFAKAFYSKTGIKPSYFVSELKSKGL
jgi:AraC-like DNA-binding protein